MSSSITFWLVLLFPLLVVLAGRLSIEAGLWMENHDGRRHRKKIMTIFIVLYSLILLLVVALAPSPV